MRGKIRFILVVFVALCGFSCTRSDTAATVPQATTVPGNVYSVEARDFAPGQLEAHYLKHGYQFGRITQQEYLDQARLLLNAPAGKDILQKVRSNGDILHYRLSTGEFAVMSQEGRIRTYFKADYQYWLRQ